MKRTLNQIYRLIWSPVLQGWVAVSETAKGRGKGSARQLVAAALSLAALATAHAAPLGGQLVTGAGSIAQAGATTTVTQTTPNLSLSWKSFNVSAKERVNFVQPSATAIAVNRITDTNGSSILGQLNANGQVYLINPNGVLFGPGAQVNVAGLVASTLNLNDASLGSATKTFSGTGTGSVINQGTLNAAPGGYVALLGTTISNPGTITAQLGTVALGAGTATTLSFKGNTLVQMRVDQSLLKSLATNSGLLQANGGTVLMSAGAQNALLASVVNNTGVVQARTVDSRGGTITLLGSMTGGTVQVGGTLDASAPSGGHGGFIETSAAHVQVAGTAKVTTAGTSAAKSGTWRIDPNDYTIAATDPANGSSFMSTAVLASSLASGNVNVQTSPGGAGNGDIFVNGPVAWSTANSLTLQASRSIAVNAPISNTSGGSLTLRSDMNGQCTSGAANCGTVMFGAGGSVALSGGGRTDLYYNPVTYANAATKSDATGNPYSARISGPMTAWMLVNDMGAAAGAGRGLQGLNTNLSGNYAMGQNIDASQTSSWNGGAGFTPIGNAAGSFTGSFDGLNHTISNLFINLPGIANVGLFGLVGTGSVLANVGLVGGSVTGGAGSGALVGNNTTGSVNNSYATLNVTGGAGSGGLVGNNTTGTIGNSYATGNVNGGAGSGGLVGSNTSGTISDSHALGNVNGGAGSGGLVGSNTSGTISGSYALGNVNGGAGSGGLVGSNTSGAISDSYALGNVNGGAGSGGLVGSNTSGDINNTWADGRQVNGGAGSGGLVGSSTSGAISNSHAHANVSGGAGSGGLVGSNTSGAITNTWADGQVKGGAGSGGLIGSSTSGAITNNHAFGNVNGAAGSGGLVGSNTSGDISNSYGHGNVNGAAGSGGLVGSNTSGAITTTWAHGNVNGAAGSGGLVGSNTSGAITYGYADGDVNGAAGSGGLVGSNTSGAISHVSANGNVNGAAGSGGLVGSNTSGDISISYARGNVTGAAGSGALVGSNTSGAITDGYAEGTVSGAAGTGGLLGSNTSGIITNSFWKY